jgi:3-oxoacyl-[acyl-carrier protein] reductase
LAIVTGGSRGITVKTPISKSSIADIKSDPGIGAAIVANLASKGCSVVLGFTSDSSSKPSADIASNLFSSYGVHILPVQADMGDSRGPAHVVATAKNHFSHPKTGKFQIDIIVNNAGVSENATLEDVTPDHFHSQYNVNVLGPLLLVQAAQPYLPTDRSGRIVNVSSVSSSLGFERQSVYGGTKAALEAMTRTWARELAEKCTVNAVNPGPVDTDMFGAVSDDFSRHLSMFVQASPSQKVREDMDSEEVIKLAAKEGGRRGKDTEIAGVVGMLVSVESAWCTGSVICANGGMKMGQ